MFLYATARQIVWRVRLSLGWSLRVRWSDAPVWRGYSWFSFRWSSLGVFQQQVVVYGDGTVVGVKGWHLVDEDAGVLVHDKHLEGCAEDAHLDKRWQGGYAGLLLHRQEVGLFGGCEVHWAAESCGVDFGLSAAWVKFLIHSYRILEWLICEVRFCTAGSFGDYDSGVIAICHSKGFVSQISFHAA